MDYRIFSFWLILVIIWNYGWPSVHPIWDVLVAVVLSLVSKKIGDYIKEKNK